MVMVVLSILSVLYFIYSYKADHQALEDILTHMAVEIDRLGAEVARLDSQCKELEKTVEQTYKTFGQLYNKEANRKEN